MKAVVQRVKNASVSVDGNIVGSIEKGYVVLLGVGNEDTEATVDKYAAKIAKLRIFADGEGKTNLSITDAKGEILLISQFTLYADCKKGNRPSFINAGNPDEAKRLYELFADVLRQQGINVQTGIFGEHMEVALINDGPFTIVLEDL